MRIQGILFLVSGGSYSHKTWKTFFTIFMLCWVHVCTCLCSGVALVCGARICVDLRMTLLLRMKIIVTVNCWSKTPQSYPELISLACLDNQFPLGPISTWNYRQVVSGHLLAFWGTQILKQELKCWAISWADKDILILISGLPYTFYNFPTQLVELQSVITVIKQYENMLLLG